MNHRLSFIFLLFAIAVNAQEIRQLELVPAAAAQLSQSNSIRIDITQDYEQVDFTSLAITSLQALDHTIEYTLEDFEGNFHATKALKIFGHSTHKKLWIAEQLFVDGDIKSVHLKFNASIHSSIYIRFFQMPLRADAQPVFIQPIEKACPCPQPGYLDRSGWCPNGDCPEHPAPELTSVDHLIVHHAASSNISGNWAGVVESIWDFHVNSNGWSDIGYNWLIDPDGIIYEGRGDDIQGAHFCGANSNTAGFCLLGNFTSELPTGPAIASLHEILAWKSCDSNLDPLGSAFHASSNKVIPTIAAHREGCATECPGETFFPTFPVLRQNVQDQINFACANLPAPTNLTGNTQSASSIALEWEDNASDETGYLLDRSTWTNQSYSQIASLAEDVNTYLDENLIANTVYFYRVRATNGPDTTAYSNELGLSTVLQSIQELERLNISVFPNPANEFINIELSQSTEIPKSISIGNVLGQQVWSAKNINQSLLLIETRNWPKGAYSIDFKLSKRNIHFPILIK